jgi:molybdopterin-guanine dinucleotide biosynthesis protein A
LIITDQRELFENLGAKVYGDLVPNQGALGGLYTGLVFASFPYTFCVACDMPFLNKPLISHLIALSPGFDSRNSSRVEDL